MKNKILIATSSFGEADTAPLQRLKEAGLKSEFHEGIRVTDQETWTAVYVPLNSVSGLDKPHYVWGCVYVIEVLAMMAPTKTYMMWDHDAAPTCLWEVADFCKVFYAAACPNMDACHVPPAFFPRPDIAVIAISEVNAPVNAGVVIFQTYNLLEVSLLIRPLTIQECLVWLIMQKFFLSMKN